MSFIVFVEDQSYNYFLDWLLNEQVNKMSLVIANINTKEVLERWDFKLEYEKPAEEASKTGEPMGKKDLKVIQQEIRNVLRQICSTVSFLPLLDCPCKYINKLILMNLYYVFLY